MSKDGRTFIGMLICMGCGQHHENNKTKLIEKKPQENITEEKIQIEHDQKQKNSKIKGLQEKTRRKNNLKEKISCETLLSEVCRAQVQKLREEISMIKPKEKDQKEMIWKRSQSRSFYRSMQMIRKKISKQKSPQGYLDLK